MQTTIQNAAREAAQAKPCLKERDALGLVRDAEDEAHELRCVLRAGQAIANLVALANEPSAIFCMQSFAELLRLHSQALEASLATLEALIGKVRTALEPYDHAKAADHLAFQTADHITSHLQQARHAFSAFSAFADMATPASDPRGEELAAALDILTIVMTERTDTLDAHLSTLAQALKTELPRNTPTGAAA